MSLLKLVTVLFSSRILDAKLLMDACDSWMTFAFFAEVVSHQHAYLLYNCCSALPSATILAFSSWIKPTIFVTGLAMSDAETNGTTVQSSINVRITKKDSLVE